MANREREREDRGDRGRSERGRESESRRGGSSSRSSFTYRERTRADVDKRSTMGSGDFDKFIKEPAKMYRPKDGDNRIRILPPTWEDAKHFGLDIYVHYGVGPDEQSYLCLNKMKGEPDPIEEERTIARRDGDEDYAKKLESKRRVLIYLIDRDNEKEGVQVWAMPWTLDKDLVKVLHDKSTGEILPIDHPEEGYDVEFTKEGTRDRTKYGGVKVARRSSPLGRESWLEYAVDHPLPDQLNYYDYDYIARVFGGAQKSGRGGRETDNADNADNEDRGRTSRRDAVARGRDRDVKKDAPLSWESVHDMTFDELCDLVAAEGINVDPKEAKDTKDLADWICEEIWLPKPVEKEEPKRSRERSQVRDEPPDDEDSVTRRLRDMRSSRGRS